MIKKFIIIATAVFMFSTTVNVVFSQTEKEAEPVKIEQNTKEELRDDSENDLYSQVELFSYALTTIQSEYAEEPTAKELIYGSLKGMLSSLDPHSQFLEPDSYKELKTETKGKFGGLGIEISIRDGLLTVITPLEDTPAWKAGIKAGDRIVKIEDEVTRDITLHEAVKKLRGKPGTDVTITILREDEFKIQDVTITREIIHIQDVKDVFVLEDKIGYVRLSEFREDTHKEFRKALDKLRAEGAESLILDLRNNPGGLLHVAIKITEEFLPADAPIVSTKGRRPSQNIETKSRNSAGDYINWPIVTLINEGSASGSEILAGALQDNKRSIIVGTKSFGKGSVQTVIPLPDGAGLRLTTSKYFTPSGRSIHGTGIVPDVEIEREYKVIEEKDSKKENVDKIFTDVELKGADNPKKIEESKKEEEVKERLKEDNQIQSAINIIKGVRAFKKFES